MADAIWATLDHVKDVTGREDVSQATLNQAEQQVELVTGAIAELTVGLLSVPDAYWLRQAVCYQAAWATDRPDLYSAVDVSSAGQDGQQAAYKADALTLAPLAKRAVKRLSWRGTRTVIPTPRGVALVGSLPDDDKLPWRPL